ncbi:YdeI/OmpD-associated family protein [Flavobacterium silvaticum]|uniref:YdhG-like domain-containing protein n=1 Tax=Flavobacterium silvaticum TaxID=1852020 RepID=A0A972FTY8_9FLAO|nr:YdeI/OmpD-associated family protein [Flavobacterium silvaticum]NMH27967.1 hypothetical protein [Flavobacterium silvaticum]
MEKPAKVWDKTGQWAEAIDLVKSIVVKTELVEMTKWGAPIFTVGGKNVAGIGGFKEHFAIWFWNGVFLKDEAGKLVNANEGVTKGLRQLRYKNMEEIRSDEKLIYDYLVEAIENEKAGLSIKPEKKQTIIPELIQKALDSDSELKIAFEKFTPFKQREFIEYVDSAKREETKVQRLEKISLMIRDGIGLNDKYRK